MGLGLGACLVVDEEEDAVFGVEAFVGWRHFIEVYRSWMV